MQHWFRHLGRRLGRGLGRNHAQGRRSHPCENLAQAEAESTVTITCNNDHKTVERGLCTGVQVTVLRNEADEPNLIVAVGDARYVLDRRIAHRIKVRAE
jgi:Fe2+ transport system protein FeoA